MIQPGAVKCKHCGETLDRLPGKEREWRQESSSAPPQPGKVQGIAIMVLIGGILATLIGVGLVLSTCFLWVPGIYSIILGIMAIIRSVSLFGPNAHQATPPKGIAIMMIVNIINVDVINLVLGILVLVFLNDPQVQDYFSRGRFRSAD
jgi:hypothetical protein